jgi:hypothetical protein
MSDRLKLVRDIAARTEPRFIEIKPEPRRKATLIKTPRQRGGGRVPFTEAELTAIRGGLTAEEFRWKTIGKWGRRYAGIDTAIKKTSAPVKATAKRNTIRPAPAAIL